MQLKEKIKFALDEGRILILGGQVLVGFGYQSVFQAGFEKLPQLSRNLQLAALTAMLAGLALVMSPAGRDRLVEKGEPTAAFLAFATRMIGWGLLPFALGLGVSVYVAMRIIAGAELAAATGTAAFLFALSMWYGLRLVTRETSEEKSEVPGSPMELKDKISHALTETRMVLPGVQAMVGFQFICMLSESFERLPPSSKYLHVASLCASVVTVIFLITPAAFHRIVEHGEATGRQHRVTTAFLLGAMLTLPPAMTGDLFVVIRKTTECIPLAAGMAVSMLAVFYGLWFIPGLILRTKDIETSRP